MRKSEACGIVARRLNLSLSRVEALVQRASEAGLLPVARGSDRPDLDALALSRLFLAAVCDRGLGNAAATVSEFSALQTENGVVQADVLEAMIAGRVSPSNIRSAVFRLSPSAAVLVSGGTHLTFGLNQSDNAASRTIAVPAARLQRCA
jgi:hypothetical protein